MTATETAATPTAQPTTCTVQFADVAPGSPFYTYIECLACRGVVSGYADGTFRPGNNVSRGQLSKIISNSAGFSEPHTGQSFQDVRPGDPFYLYIERLASRGVIGGYACGGAGEPCVAPANLPYFRPANASTRGQITKIDVLAAQQVFGWPLLDPAINTFQDVPRGSTFYQYIETAVAHSVLSGYACGQLPAGACIPPGNKPYFLPGDNTSRGQMAKIASNTFFAECGQLRRP